jgi:hypothetical protein
MSNTERNRTKTTMNNLLNEIEDFLVVGILGSRSDSMEVKIGKNHFISRFEWIIRKYRGEEHLVSFYKNKDIKYVKNEGLSRTDNMNGSYHIKDYHKTKN